MEVTGFRKTRKTKTFVESSRLNESKYKIQKIAETSFSMYAMS